MKGVSFKNNEFILILPRFYRESDIPCTCKRLLVKFLPSAYGQKTIGSGAMESLFNFLYLSDF
ncbi:hypothetical protein SAMN04487764_1069 [Gillisia sp. Hel1_33_143]|nr:hypothetical protein SAMN04487764_1069 [Gillisia sp. Hel1_33_143]